MMLVRITLASAVGTAAGPAWFELAVLWAMASQPVTVSAATASRPRTFRSLIRSRPGNDVQQGAHPWVGLLAALQLRVDAPLTERLQMGIQREHPVGVGVRPVADSLVAHAAGEGEQDPELGGGWRCRGRAGARQPVEYRSACLLDRW